MGNTATDLQPTIKIYTDAGPLNTGKAKNWSPLLTAHLAAPSLSPVELTDSPGDADLFALPMHWSYYLWNNKANMGEAMWLAGLAAERDKKVVVWYKGDLVPVMPFDNAIVFAPGFLRSAMKGNYRAAPVFVDDPKQAPLVHKSAKPSVGFCGFGSISKLKTLYGFAMGIPLAAAGKFGQSDYTGRPVLPVTTIRTRALKLLSNDSAIDTNFIIRTGDTDISNSTSDFFANIYENDYTLCVRGYGNWSYRFYQTLACGRVPVFIDTNCVLPLSSVINWKEYCVWVDRSEMKYIGEKVADYHGSMTDSDFVERQSACRDLWEKHFTPKGFLSNLGEYLG